VDVGSAGLASTASAASMATSVARVLAGKGGSGGEGVLLVLKGSAGSRVVDLLSPEVAARTGLAVTPSEHGGDWSRVEYMVVGWKEATSMSRSNVRSVAVVGETEEAACAARSVLEDDE